MHTPDELFCPLVVSSSQTALPIVGGARRPGDFPGGHAPGGATGGPENVLLVVNPRSPDSLCIANHYAKLRHIPPNNFFFLDWDPKQDNTDVDTFREKILLPVLRVRRNCAIPGRQIDYVVYSSDFPWGIRIDEDIKKFKAALEKAGRAGKRREARRQAASLDESSRRSLRSTG